MTMRQMVIGLMILAGTANAEQDARKVVMLKHAQPERIQKLLQHFGVAISVDRQSKALALSGPSSALEAAEQAIQKLDVPEPALRQVELIAHVLVASFTPPETATPDPPDLAPVIKQLRATFPYKHYRLADTLLMRTTENDRVFTQGSIGNQAYEFRVVRTTVTQSDSNVRSVRLDNLNLTIKGYLVIETTTEIREGQKVVIGKATGEDTDAYFRILSAKVVQ